jgi:hypothetical protein
LGKVKFKLNLPGLNELMKSAAMQGILNSAAASIAASAGDGYEIEAAHNINFIGIASVKAATRAARKDCSENKTLLKAAGGVRI